nr:rhombosortase [Vibrio algivorus]
MQWNHNAIMTGQWWRIVTGNLTHTNLYHLAMNVAGLWVISFIFRANLEARQFLLVFTGLCLSVGSLLLFTSMQIYVGLSGVLHGLFAFYALVEYRLGRKSNALLLTGLTAKILWEQWFGSATGSEALIGAKVAIDAHLFGAISGAVLAIIVKPTQVGTNR